MHMESSESSAFSVSEVTLAIRDTLESFGSIAVVGEVSNFKAHGSGHRYFSLKDAHSSLSCAMWRSRPLRFTPTDGMQVVARGTLSVYPPRGTYSLDVTSMQPFGLGDAQAALEALKKELARLGYFSPERKKALPRWPKRVGIATSDTGAAIQDMLTTLGRRMPLVEVVLRPTTVQGDGAAADIARAIQSLDAHGVDVIIVGRGGGSAEDLWAFNTEEVARAIFLCHTPIISAVGHETDVTIADFVADVRAATPTAAAELAVRNRADVRAELAIIAESLYGSVEYLVEQQRHTARRFMEGGIERRLLNSVERMQKDVAGTRRQCEMSMSYRLSTMQRTLMSQTALLRSLRPLAPLDRGFALIKKDGGVVAPDSPLLAGDEVEIITKSNSAKARIISSEPTGDPH